MDISTSYRWLAKTGITSGKAAALAFLLLCGCIVSNNSHSAENILDAVNPGFFVGLNYGEGYIDGDGSNEFNNVSGLSLAFSGFVEIPVTNLLSISAEFHGSNVMEFGKTSASSTGAMVSFGGTLGRIKNSPSPYLSASVGYSYVDVGDSGEIQDVEEDEGCVAFVPCFSRPTPFRRGGHAKGLGYRIATGLSVSSALRFELAYLNYGGESSSLPDGAAATLRSISAGVHVQFK